MHPALVGQSCEDVHGRCVDALVMDERWASAVTLNRSSPAAEVGVNVAQAEAERKKEPDSQPRILSSRA